jgi:hypothetical protein
VRGILFEKGEGGLRYGGRVKEEAERGKRIAKAMKRK